MLAAPDSYGYGPLEDDERRTMTTNDWCRSAGIEAPPVLEHVAAHREANTFALLLVTLLERGAPMTLADVASRFERAGIAPRDAALRALQRCRPARPPVHRDGELYHLDPHDDELDLWAFRLGLRPARVAPKAAPRPPPALVRGPDEVLTSEELDLAWRNASLHSWSAQRLALAVLDAAGSPLSPAHVLAELSARTGYHVLRDAGVTFARRGSAVTVLDDGRWAVAHGAADALRQARVAVRERVALARRHATMRRDPAEIDAAIAENDRRKAAHAAELARMSRVLLCTFPLERPRVATLLDVEARTIATFLDADLDDARARLARFDVIGALDVRRVLRGLGVGPTAQRLAELGPAQKTKKLNRRGRTLRITPDLLVQGSCGISNPFGAAEKLAAYLAEGDTTKLVRRLEADVKSLLALYEYGRLHGGVRLRWGFLDEWLPAPWTHRDEPTIHHLKKSALSADVPLQVVIGSAPGWTEPWSRARLVRVQPEPGGWRTFMVADDGYVVDDRDVQRARLAVDVH
jgi:hypothetical protein